MRLVALVALAVFGCGNGTPKPAMDMTLGPGDMTVYSLCGHPGDPGNSNAVGKYCVDNSACTGNPAFICSTIMPIPQGPTYFCTLACDPNAANPNAPCGPNASCTCLMPGACGCVPDLCRLGLYG
jgi:hypothetical protein